MVSVREEGAERGVELVELLPAVALVRVVAELPVATGAAAGAVSAARGGGGVGGRRGEILYVVVVVEVEVRPRRRRQLATAACGEDVRLQRRDAAAPEGVVEQLVVHAC